MSYSITSSARARTDVGMSRPSALAVLKARLSFRIICGEVYEHANTPRAPA
jgi:hypothetical protein